MADRALLGRGLVEQHCLSLYQPGQFVTVSAAHILVRSPQRECCSLVVVEQRRLPPGTIVTLCTTCYVRLGKLPAVDVLMALLTLGWRSFEIDVDQLRFQIRRLVACNAGSRPMRTEQRKLRLRVIESGNFLP